MAKMGHLDLAYTAGARGSRDKYKRFAAAVDRRDGKKAGIEPLIFVPAPASRMAADVFGARHA